MHYVIDFNLLEEIENQLNVYLKLFVIMYANDTVIMSETKDNLMSFLNIVSFGNLKLMSKKLKFLFFSRGRLPKNLTFTFNEMEIGIVSEFNYLGVLFSKFGTVQWQKKLK
jgi:hypothetical protein